jgi:soluble lytic murein transglycosylase
MREVFKKSRQTATIRVHLGARTRALTLVWLFAFGLAALGTGEAFSASRGKDTHAHPDKAATAGGRQHGAALNAKRHAAASLNEKSRKAMANVPLPIERPAAASLPPDLGAAKQAIELIRKSKWNDAAALAASIVDPAAKKLIEWALLRSSDSPAKSDPFRL